MLNIVYLKNPTLFKPASVVCKQKECSLFNKIKEMIRPFKVQISENQIFIEHLFWTKIIRISFIVLMTNLIALLIAYFILHSKPLNEQTKYEYIITIFFILILYLDMILEVYKDYKYSKNLTITSCENFIKLNEKIIQKPEIESLNLIKILFSKSDIYYIVIKTRSKKNDVISIRLNEEETNLIIKPLESMIGKNSLKSSKLFEFMII